MHSNRLLRYIGLYTSHASQVRAKKTRIREKRTRKKKEREIFDPLLSMANKKSDPTRAKARNIQRKPESTHPSARSFRVCTRPLMEPPLPRQSPLVVYLPRRTKNATKQTSGW